MAERKVLVCDNCDNDGAKKWNIGQAGKAGREVDLCADCDGVLHDLMKMGRPPGGGRRGPYKKFQKAKIKDAP